MGSNTPEGKRKAKLKAEFKRLGIWNYMPANNGFGVSGIPDFVLVVRGLFWGVEVKADGGKPTALQVLRGQEIVAAGGKWSLVDSEESFRQLIVELEVYIGA